MWRRSPQLRTRALAGFGLLLTCFAHPTVASAATIENVIELNQPAGVAIGPDGMLYVCEVGNHVIQQVDLRTRKSKVIAGQYGKKGYSGDGGPAVDALLNQPYELRFHPNGDLYFVEIENFIVRKIDHKTKVISTVAGTGSAGFSGDGGPAVQAQFLQPHSIAFDRDNGLLVADVKGNRIRRVDLRTGLIRTIGGTGEKGVTPEGARLSEAPLNGPRSLDVDREGNLVIVLREGNAVYVAARPDGKLTRIAGTGEKGYSGDGGPALQAGFNGPKGITISPHGIIFLADTENHVIRKLDPRSGVLTTVAGTGSKGDGPVGDATKCGLNRPHGLFAAADGSLYIGDTDTNKVRVVRLADR